MSGAKSILEVYTEVLDFLQWSEEINDEKAQKILSVIAHFKRHSEDIRKVAERYKQALKQIEDLHVVASLAKRWRTPMENLADFLFENLKFTPKDFGFDKKESSLVNARATMASVMANDILLSRVASVAREIAEWNKVTPPDAA